MKSLIEARDADTDVVCYHNPESGFDEPLLAVYEKQCASLLLNFYQNGHTSLQQFLKNVRTKRIVSMDTKRIKSFDS
jgi:molybdopterin-guanine dinucleotide biosynthesis protein A